MAFTLQYCRQRKISGTKILTIYKVEKMMNKTSKVFTTHFLVISILFSSTLFGQTPNNTLFENRTQGLKPTQASKYFENLTQLALEGKIKDKTITPPANKAEFAKYEASLK